MTLMEEARERLASGPYLPIAVRAEARIAVIVAIDHGSSQVADLVEEIVDLQLAEPTFKPVLIVRDVSTHPLSKRDLRFETVLTEDRWRELGLAGSYDRFLEQRLLGVRRLYEPDIVVIADPDEPLPSWAIA